MSHTSIKVSAKYQITLLQAICKQLGIKPGNQLIMDVQDNMIILIPEPKHYVSTLQSRHSEIWKGLDVQEYLDGERRAWVNYDQ